MEERTLFKIWLFFLFLGLSFHVVFYFHNKSTLLNISYWCGLLLSLIIIQNFINNPIKNSRYTLIIYPVIATITIYLLQKIISPYIHFNMNGFFYFFENKRFYENYISYINSVIGQKNALMLFSLSNIAFYITFIFFMAYYLIVTPITTLRRVYNGLFSLIGIILLIHCILPTEHVVYLKESSDNMISSNNFFITYTNIRNLSLVSFEVAVSLFIGLTIFRNNKAIGGLYLLFVLFIIGSSLYFKMAYITDVCLAIVLSLFVFFKIDKGFSHNKTSFNI